jgi:hypothetical protein
MTVIGSVVVTAGGDTVSVACDVVGLSQLHENPRFLLFL